jgi:hypothetical protein
MVFQIKLSFLFNKDILAKQWVDAKTAISESILEFQKGVFCLCFQFFV